MVDAYDALVKYYRGRRVLVTGHTGFKGAWLVEWLLSFGAKVSGFALPPLWSDSLHEQLRHVERMTSTMGDVLDAATLRDVLVSERPETVFHLAAQPLVVVGYREPVLTWRTNVEGTLNVLEAIRAAGSVSTAVVATTDKVYRNREWVYPYRETDELGGHDPYSASKAACEIAVSSWVNSFGQSISTQIVTARAGNVIGAGDWNEARIVPDCFRAWREQRTVRLRRPRSTRPWQHVLEPISGYLSLAERIDRASEHRHPAVNFGPRREAVRTVGELVHALAGTGRGRHVEVGEEDATFHEAGLLSLSTELAESWLGWKPMLDFEESVRWTDAGYSKDDDLPAVVQSQIAEYVERIRRSQMGASPHNERNSN